ncbi:MAG TPA: HRDC domain-containing protein [Blastocatellia bacterium]|nr:HRDC domain-containing protein [Blastocatellia bacterium]
MLAKVITLKFNSIINAFDDEPLKEFIKDKEVHSIRDHFFIKNDSPYLAMVVTYSMSAQLLPQTKNETKKDESWRDLIKEEDVPLFNTLRDWRNERAKKEGLSPYIVFTNRQLASIVAARPSSLTRLAEIEGIGKMKTEKYGTAILKLLAPPSEDQPQETFKLEPPQS